jgi:hypothetical protein
VERGCKERVKEGEYAFICENGKMRPVESIPGTGEER